MISEDIRARILQLMPLKGLRIFSGGIMNNTDKRQMIEEKIAHSKTKENSTTFMKAFKDAVTLKNI